MATMRARGDQVVSILNGVPQLLGTIVATVTKNNHDTAVPFNDTGDALKGKCLLLQADAECYVYFGALNTQAATTSHIHLFAGERVIVFMNNLYGFVACVSVTGTTNLRVFELT